MLTIRTLGKFQIRDEEHIVNEEEIRSPKMINLLAYLILHRNQTLTFYDMADALWQWMQNGSNKCLNLQSRKLFQRRKSGN